MWIHKVTFPFILSIHPTRRALCSFELLITIFDFNNENSFGIFLIVLILILILRLYHFQSECQNEKNTLWVEHTYERMMIALSHNRFPADLYHRNYHLMYKKRATTAFLALLLFEYFVEMAIGADLRREWVSELTHIFQNSYHSYLNAMF